MTGASHYHGRGSEEKARPDVFSDDARPLSMSTPEKLVSASDDVRRDVQSVWYDVVTAKAMLEPIKGHFCVAGMYAKSWSILAECSWSQRISENLKSTASPFESQERVATGIQARYSRLQETCGVTTKHECQAFNALCTPVSVDD